MRAGRIARVLAAVVAAGTLSACAAPRVGYPDRAALLAEGEEVVLVGASPAAALARCFEIEARLLPFSVVRWEPDIAQTTYRLQGFGLWLEEASFRDRPEGGAEIRYRYPANYDARWREGLERDRLEPLRRCAAGTVAASAG